MDKSIVCCFLGHPVYMLPRRVCPSVRLLHMSATDGQTDRQTDDLSATLQKQRRKETFFPQHTSLKSVERHKSHAKLRSHAENISPQCKGRVCKCLHCSNIVETTSQCDTTSSSETENAESEKESTTQSCHRRSKSHHSTTDCESPTKPTPHSRLFQPSQSSRSNHRNLTATTRLRRSCLSSKIVQHSINGPLQNNLHLSEVLSRKRLHRICGTTMLKRLIPTPN